MRGKVAKAIRARVYGDESLRQKRKYGAKDKKVMFNGKVGISRTVFNMPDSPRARYQNTKKFYKKVRRGQEVVV